MSPHLLTLARNPPMIIIMKGYRFQASAKKKHTIKMQIVIETSILMIYSNAITIYVIR